MEFLIFHGKTEIIHMHMCVVLIVDMKISLMDLVKMMIKRKEEISDGI